MSCNVSTDFCIPQGADWSKTLKITDETGVGIDLTGSSFAGQARKTYTNPTAYSFTFSLRNQLTNPGEVDWIIPDTLFSALVLNQDDKYVYDIEWTDATSTKKRILSGKLTITPEVTR